MNYLSNREIYISFLCRATRKRHLFYFLFHFFFVRCAVMRRLSWWLGASESSLITIRDVRCPFSKTTNNIYAIVWCCECFCLWLHGNGDRTTVERLVKAKVKANIGDDARWSIYRHIVAAKSISNKTVSIIHHHFLVVIYTQTHTHPQRWSVREAV